ncbi:MAG: tolQ-type transporter [Gemmatales bacterium]|nr:MAG: tolQ-type transporter [Gemmatales bacterium]
MNRISLWCLFLFVAVLVPSLSAQDGPKPGGEQIPDVGSSSDSDEKATLPPQEDSNTVLGMIRDSGWSGWIFMAVLGLFSLAAVMVILERLVNMTQAKTIPLTFVLGLRELLEKEESETEQYRELCEHNPSPAASILHAGVLRAGRPVPEVEKSLEDAMVREVATLRSRIRPLNVVGSIAPLVGLLGTVVGMIIAFKTASTQGLGGKAQVLAEGIYLALLTTAAGLSIAIPSLLFAAFFNNRIDKFMRQIDELLIECPAQLSAMQPLRKRSKQSANAELVTADN